MKSFPWRNTEGAFPSFPAVSTRNASGEATKIKSRWASTGGSASLRASPSTVHTCTSKGSPLSRLRGVRSGRGNRRIREGRDARQRQVIRQRPSMLCCSLGQRRGEGLINKGENKQTSGQFVSTGPIWVTQRTELHLGETLFLPRPSRPIDLCSLSQPLSIVGLPFAPCINHHGHHIHRLSDLALCQYFLSGAISQKKKIYKHHPAVNTTHTVSILK